jgi:outer membrane protein OmpA-like peptidoglycan-associated protein
MKKSLLAVVAATSVLAACASEYDIEGTRSMQAQGTPFTSALHDAYVVAAAAEREEADWYSARQFNMRAQMAAAGTAPAVPALDGRDNADVSLHRARIELIDRLNTAAPQDAPKACAQAQVAFEHWVEQAREVHQVNDILSAADTFTAALEDCQPTPMLVRDFTVYFPHNSAELTSAASAELTRAAEIFKDLRSAEVALTGFTDTSGDDAYNRQLSLLRTEAVADALVSMGVPASAIESNAYGEVNTPVSTGDGVREVENRRVMIKITPNRT